MSEIILNCNAVETFDAFMLRDWLEKRRAAGSIPQGEATLLVSHPEREGDGSCRWCGATNNEVHRLVDGRLAP